MSLDPIFRPFVVAVCLVIAASTNAAPPSFAGKPLPHFIDESKLPFDALSGTETTRLYGVHKGAGYRIEVPENWNGDLVLHAHGFRGFCEPDGSGSCELTVSNPPIRRYLIDNGFAWGASSYAENGYQIRAGVLDTHALGTLFRGLVGNPRHTYLIGFSMGGHITGVSIEQFPNFYAGAMPMCGVMGDNELFDFFLDANMVATTLAGLENRIQFPLPENFNYQEDVVPDIKSALGLAFPVVLNAEGQHVKRSWEILTGGTRPIYEHGWLFWNLIASDFVFGLFGGDSSLGAAPASVTSNIETIYQLDNDPELNPDEVDLNARVPRKDSPPQAIHPNGLAAIPRVNGTFRIPVLSLHTLGDLFVPFHMQQIFKRRAMANGVGDLLVQRAIRDPQHCGFSLAEMEEGFGDLVSWVETGMKPAGDDVLDPTEVAAEDYGCQFTTPVSGPGRPSAFFDVLGPPFPPLPECP